MLEISKEELDNTFKKIGKSYSDIFLKRAAMPNNHYEKMAELIVSFGGNVLDIGCGPGALWGELIKQGYDETKITGIDFSPHMVKRASERYSGATVLLRKTGTLPFRNNTFSNCVIMHVLEHLTPEDAEETIKEAMRVTKNYIIIDWFASPKPKKRAGEIIVYKDDDLPFRKVHHNSFRLAKLITAHHWKLKQVLFVLRTDGKIAKDIFWILKSYEVNKR